MGREANARLIKGTTVYMIGNMTSKLLQMLILPLLTSILLTDEYGYYDLIFTTINLVTPIITLQIIEGMFRFSFDINGEEKKSLITTTTLFLLAGIGMMGVIFLFGNLLCPNLEYPWLIYVNYIAAIFFDYSQKMARAQQLNKQFAVSGVMHTLSMLILQAITLLLLNLRIDGMLISSCGSYIISGVYLQVYVRTDKYLSKKAFSKDILKKLVNYSAPLVPNSIAWWLVASSDRYVISFFIGTAATGIYSISGKFSQLLTFATGVFQMAWQESAILEVNSKDRDRFYTETFNTYMRLLFTSYLVILPVIRLAFPILIDTKFQEAYVYNPILLIGSVFSAFSQFYGSSYIVFKKTSGAFSTSVIAAMINVIIGIGTVNWIGLYGPALGTAVSFLVQWIIRAVQMKPYFKVKVDVKSLFVLGVLCTITTGLYYLDIIGIHIFQFIAGTMVFLVVNRQYAKLILAKIGGKKNETNI